MSRVVTSTVLVVLLAACTGALAQDGLLLHYAFDEGAGAVATDASDNQLNGTVAAAWVESPSGKALSLDGQAPHIVRVQVPMDLRFGKDSWTFSAWLKPTQFSIEDRQNQRRIFNFGVFPDGNLVIDIMSNGRMSYYFCYRNEAGTITSTGGTAATALKLGEWSYIALVCDRANRRVQTYLNGFSQGTFDLPAAFDGDFKLGGELTFGSGWHNYWGLMDEVRVYRRALSKAEIKAQFAALKDTFGAVGSPEAIAAERREALMEAFAKTHELWAEGDFSGVRAACAAVAGSPDCSPALRSYANLRIAQSFIAEGKPDLARAEYAKIAATQAYPEVHRDEATRRVAELDRMAKGLPARDPAASRTAVPKVTDFAAQVFVSSDGNDEGSGTKASPVATLARARDLIRTLKAQGITGAMAVNILPGEYPVTDTFALTLQDSGSPDAPVVYRATQPGKAVFYGGARITGFEPVTDPVILARLPEEGRGKVVCCNLRAQGIADLGQLAVRGYSQPPAPPTLELFVNGKPMTLARWPNEGFVGISKLLEPGDRGQKKPSVFEYIDDRHARWTQAEDPWLFGYFRYLWADATIKVSKIDPVSKTVTCNEAYQYGRPGMDTGQGIQYYAFNLLEELDQPGEWYLDRKTGILYLCPPTDLEKATVEVGVMPGTMVTVDGATDIRFEGLTFDLGRASGMLLTNCSRCLIAGCTVSRMAANGITIRGGEADGLLGCDIHTVGRRATEVIGGDRASLTPGRHFVENCQIHSFGRIDRTYTPAIQLEGVGHHIAHNLMYDGPSSVMRIEGNDHIIEYNEVYNAVTESDDQGAMELFANPTYRGVVFRYNRYTDCGKLSPGVAVHGQAAIRLDDVISGMLIYGNVFIRSANGHFGAVQINSGRDNIIDNNLFVDCKQGVSGGWNPGNNVWRQIADNKQSPAIITSELYLKRYPLIATMMEQPGINYVWRNVFYRCGPITTGNSALLDLMDNGVFPDQDPGFVDAAKGDYHIKPGASLFAAVGFEPIPLDEIGLYQDVYRASWPVAVAPQRVPDWRPKPAQ
jgi:hypothetical protein